MLVDVEMIAELGSYTHPSASSAIFRDCIGPNMKAFGDEAIDPDQSNDC